MLYDVGTFWYICLPRAKLMAWKKYKDYGSFGQECERCAGFCNTPNYPVLSILTSNVFDTLMIKLIRLNAI